MESVRQIRAYYPISFHIFMNFSFDPIDGILTYTFCSDETTLGGIHLPTIDIEFYVISDAV